MALMPSDMHNRWECLAQYGLEKQHGQACRLSLMYALTLRRAAAAETSQVRHVRPRVWEAEGSRKHRSERVALFSDDVVHALLHMIELTKDFPRPNFPVAPCGSSSVDVWCHSLASRKQYRGKTNFEALSEQFLLRPSTDGGQWAPNAIYMVAAAVFRCRFAYDPLEAPHILTEQLGLKTFKTALYVSQIFSVEASPGMGRVERRDGQMFWEEDRALDVLAS